MDTLLDHRVERTEHDTVPHFVVIGSGQVYHKYWEPAQNLGIVKVDAVIGTDDLGIFEKYNPSNADLYKQTSSLENTIRLLKDFPNVNIAILTPADVRPNIIARILQDQANQVGTIFVEKPYARTVEELNHYKALIEQFPTKLHLAGKYATGRADILYPKLPQTKPNKITASLREGSKYYDVVKSRLDATGNHPYIADGPELDLGFHMLDIISNYCIKTFNGFEQIKIKDIQDMSIISSDFDPRFASKAELTVMLSDGNEIDVGLTAGKWNGENQRFIEFDYGDKKITQEFSVGNSDDPVYEQPREGEKRLVAQHPEGHHYYSVELQADSFGKQASLDITQLCIEMKSQREENLLSST